MEAKRIFMVEDDLALLETLQELFRLYGYECLGCSDAGRAIKQIEQSRPDLVILDYMLPEWNAGDSAMPSGRSMDLQTSPLLLPRLMLESYFHYPIMAAMRYWKNRFLPGKSYSL